MTLMFLPQLILGYGTLLPEGGCMSWAVEEMVLVLDSPRSEAWIIVTKYSSTSVVNSWPIQVCVNMKELFIVSVFIQRNNTVGTCRVNYNLMNEWMFFT